MDKDIYVLDTFAGAGGFSLGFEQSGFKILGAIEVDKWACETFQFNHKNAIVIKEDITKLTDEQIKESFKNTQPQIILGGPPCQGYSICNVNNGDPKDPRNSLFEEFLRLGDIFQPELMIMENVPNLTNAKTGNSEKVIDIIVKELKNREYYVYKDILSANDYGVPQIRKRLFVIASKKPLTNPFPEPTHSLDETSGLEKTPNLWDAISDLNVISAREGAEESEYSNEIESDYQKKVRASSRKLYNHKAMNHTKRVVERFEAMTWGDSISDVPAHLKPLIRNGNGKISEKVYDQNNRRMHPFKPCHTITASFYANFVHPYSHRNFTAREGARIQSFPDSYIFKGKPTVVSQKLLAREGRIDEKFLGQYNQIGNAVPPMLSKAIADNLKKQLF